MIRSLSKLLINGALLIVFFLIKTISFCQTDSTISSIQYTNHDVFDNKTQSTLNKKAFRKLQRKRELGYLSCSVDSISFKNGKPKYKFTLGEKYYWDTLVINPSSFDNIDQPKGRFSLNRLNKIHKKLLNELQNSGYPKARINQHANFRNDSISIIIDVKTGEFIVYDSLIVDSAFLSSYNYIQSLTGIKQNKPFQTSLIQTLPSSINKSTIYEYLGHSILLKENKATLNLQLEENKTNSFTGFAGFQPDTEDKMVITGQVALHLKNSFHQGEQINLDWKRATPLSQLLNVNFSLPFMFKSPVGITTGITLDKQDSTFTNTNISGGLSFYLGRYGFLSTEIQYINSLLNYTINNTSNSTISKLYGTNYQTKNLNNNLNPNKGYILNAGIFVGNRELTDSNAYSARFIRYDYNINLSVFIPLGKNTLLLMNKMAAIHSDSLKQHELKRIGGIESIRGFNENSIFSKSYNIISLEYRYMLDKFSNINAFYDIGFSNDIAQNIESKNRRMSIGLGMNINTRAGMLSISYAVGKHNKQPFIYNEGKIHIGYVNQF